MLDKLDARYNYFKEHSRRQRRQRPARAADAQRAPAPPRLSAAPLRDPSHNQHQPTVLYNAMIRPARPLCHPRGHLVSG